VSAYRKIFGNAGRHALLAGAALAGGAIQAQTVPAGADLAVLAAPSASTNWSLAGNAALQSGVITLPAGTPGLTIEGAGNTVTLASPGYFSIASAGSYTLNLQDITFSGSTETGNGGVIAASGVANTLQINAGGAVTFSDNTAASGGAIAASSLTIAGNGGTIDLNGNTATSAGGAIYSAGPLTVNNPGGTVNLQGNNSTGSSGGGAIMGGGAVTITGGAIAIDGNSAVAAGGAVVASGTSGVMTIGDANTQSIQVQGNHSNNDSGALRAGALISVTGQTVDFSGNTTTGNGGALWTSLTSSSATGVLISGNSITLDSNQANGQGAAIFARSNVIIGDTDSASVALTNNQSRTGGGAVMVYDGTGAGGTVTVNGLAIDISHNSTTGSVPGGAIFAAGAALVGNDDSVVTIDGNANNGQAGGAIYAGTVQIDGQSIALTSNQSVEGGAVAGTNVTIGSASATDDLNLSGNRAQFGGAIFADGTLTINGGGQITGNTATTGSGGAIYMAGALILNATVANGITFSDNTSGGAPNAIFLDGTTASTAALNATGGNIVFFDPINSNAVNLNTVTANASGTNAVIFDGSNNANASPVYAQTTVQSGIFAVQKGADYGALFTEGPTSFTVASGATLAGGGAGAVQADSFTLSSGGTLDISGSGITPGNAAIGLPPGAAAVNGMSTFSIAASNAGAGVNLSGGTVKFNLCGNQQKADVLDLTSAASPIAITGGATPVFTQIAGCTGAATTGNGILIVRSNSPDDALFTVADGATVSISGVDYTLKQVVDAGADTYNWYLQSDGPSILPGPAAPIPTLSETALALLALLLGGGAALTLRRARAR
jgi:predicted outer membrane repeat protein